eukprot:scaffold13564_cov128-Alexandrium_tamarense.AAC.20
MAMPSHDITLPSIHHITVTRHHVTSPLANAKIGGSSHTPQHWPNCSTLADVFLLLHLHFEPDDSNTSAGLVSLAPASTYTCNTHTHTLFPLALPTIATYTMNTSTDNQESTTRGGFNRSVYNAMKML